MPVVAAIPAIMKVGSVVSTVAGAIGGKKAASGANAQADTLSKEAEQSGKNLQKIGEEMSSRSAERWDFYKEHGENVDVMLIDDAVNMFKETFAGGSERAAARAAEDVASAFDRSAEVRRRAALRFGGVDPTSGKFQGLERETETARAKAEAAARFSARRTEEDRARSALGNASDLANRAIGQANELSRTGVASEKSAAAIFSGQAVDQRADAAGSAALVGDIAGKIPFGAIGDMITDKWGNKQSAVSDSSETMGPPAPVPTGQQEYAGPPQGFATGGAIPGDGRSGGKLKGPGTGTSDSINAVVDGTNQKVRLSAGEFIIPEKVVRQRGERFFNQLIGR